MNPATNNGNPDVEHVKVEDALSYLDKVRSRYIQQPQIYSRFIDIMREFKTQSLDTLDVIHRIKELLQDSPDLIADFNVFIPEDYRCPPVITTKITTTADAADAVTTTTTAIENKCHDHIEPQPPLKASPVPKLVEVANTNAPNTPVKNITPVKQQATPVKAKAPPPCKEPNRIIINEEIVDVRELDPSMCRRLGQSYCQAPKNFHLPKCSGRTSICDEVLNDVWLSVPQWTESAAGIRSKKMPNEKRINQIEDQRFELDFVIQTNAEAIKYLRVIESSMSIMSPEELNNFQLDECIGSRSSIHLRAVRRIYGDIAAAEIIEGLMRCPKVAVPIVLKRLEGKDEEWRAEQRKFNKVWREEMERCYRKSLDHQASKFKQRDIKALRSTSLIAEIQSKVSSSCDDQ